MIEALLHRKLPFHQENMEDILTSNVFGMLQYVPPKEGLFPFLARARTAEAVGNYLNPLQNLSGGLEAVKYQFWPEWQVRQPTGARRIQPDVALQIQSDSGESYMVAIEAKYHSGKSSEGEMADEEAEEEGGQEDDEGSNQVEAKAVSVECADQLAREWIALVDEAKVRNAKPILIYLTAGFSYPKEQIRASLNEYRGKRPDTLEPLICWLSWRELADLFDTAPEQSPLRAISRMIEQMGLTYFRGISKVAPIGFRWRFPPPETSALPRAWRFHVEPIVSRWRFGQVAFDWSFRVPRIVCQWRFQESVAPWHFNVAPIVSRWRFKR